MWNREDDYSNLARSSQPRSKTKRIPYSPSQTRCYCGELAVMKTSWTDQNQARRFLTYQRFKVGRSCGFFMLFDLEMFRRSIDVIPMLLKMLRKMEKMEAA